MDHGVTHGEVPPYKEVGSWFQARILGLLSSRCSYLKADSIHMILYALINQTNQYIRCWHLSHCPAPKVQTSMRRHFRAFSACKHKVRTRTKLWTSRSARDTSMGVYWKLLHLFDKYQQFMSWLKCINSIGPDKQNILSINLRLFSYRSD